MSNYIYARQVTITKGNYLDFITRHAPKELDKYIETLDIDDLIECYVFGFDKSSLTYDNLWLIPLYNNYGHYIPVSVEDINTSSYYALWSCGWDDDNEYIEDGINYNYWSVNKILKNTQERYRKGLEKYLLKRDFKKISDECLYERKLIKSHKAVLEIIV